MSLTVGDGVDSSTPVTAAVRVNNALPFITTNSSTLAVDEGSVAVNSGTFGDVPADVVTLTASSGTVVDNGMGPGVGLSRRPTVRPTRGR